MSEETMNWLNENVLVGFTAQRGNAWHWRQGVNNHYSDAIPVQDVQKRLFDFEPVKVETEFVKGDQHVWSGEYIYTASDTGEKLCATTGTHKVHSYSEWLIQNVSNAMDDSVQIGSAGLLKGRTVAWVQIEFPENRQIQNVAYRPTILATTSLDQSLPTTYKPVNTIVVCDNTLQAATSESSEAYRIRHTKNSQFQVLDAREKIGIILDQQAEAFEAEVGSLLDKEVSAKQFDDFLKLVNPIPADAGRGKTLALNKRVKLEEMWRYDPRVAIWQNTAWGVLQLMNTYAAHERTFKGNEAESKLMAQVTGKAFDNDAVTMAYLDRVMASL